MGMKDKHWQVYLAGRMSGISHSDAIGWRYNAEKLFRGVEKYHGCKFTRYEKSMNDVVEYIEDFYCS